jgi:DHA2 family multidrug resistance protein
VNAVAATGPPPLSGGVLAVTALALALGTFMQVLDTSIANVSIPTIAGDLGVSSDQGTWVITSFAVSNGVSVPLTGWLMQRFGVVRTFLLSVLAFTAASLLCGLSWSLPSLIVFRVLQGAVSGPMIPGSQALLINIFGPARRGIALAIWSITALVGPIAGPVLGGYISDNYNWPWIFFINIPVGVFCGFICWRFLRSQETPTRKLRVDVIGIGLLVVWVGALQIMLDKGKDLDWFQSTPIVVLALVTVIGFAAWLIWEMTESAPIVDLSLFKSRSFALGTLALCLGYAVFFGNVVLMPLWLQEQIGYTATWAGLVTAPSGLVAVLISPLIGRLMAPLRRTLVRVGIVPVLRHFVPDARALNRGCQFRELRFAAAGSGHGHGHVFCRLAGHYVRPFAAAKGTRGIGSIQLSAHRRRRFRDLADHHLLGSTRSVPSVAHRGVGHAL